MNRAVWDYMTRGFIQVLTMDQPFACLISSATTLPQAPCPLCGCPCYKSHAIWEFQQIRFFLGKDHIIFGSVVFGTRFWKPPAGVCILGPRVLMSEAGAYQRARLLWAPELRSAVPQSGLLNLVWDRVLSLLL